MSDELAIRPKDLDLWFTVSGLHYNLTGERLDMSHPYHRAAAKGVLREALQMLEAYEPRVPFPAEWSSATG